MNVQFDWDTDKAQSNYRKHGILFEEGVTVFEDPLSITIADPDHSDNEECLIDIGMSNRGRILVVVYTERRAHIRVISCRPATRAERRIYEQA
ncbi:MAG: BrnT family toxin [Caldilineaceae bacterium]